MQPDITTLSQSPDYFVISRFYSITNCIMPVFVISRYDLYPDMPLKWMCGIRTSLVLIHVAVIFAILVPTGRHYNRFGQAVLTLKGIEYWPFYASKQEKSTIRPAMWPTPFFSGATVFGYFGHAVQRPVFFSLLSHWLPCGMGWLHDIFHPQHKTNRRTRNRFIFSKYYVSGYYLIGH